MIKQIHYTLALCFVGLFSYAQEFTEIQKVTASDRESEDRMGWSVDISGDYAIVGAYGDDFGAVDPNMGSAYIYERSDDGTWEFAQKIFNSDQDDYDRFGWAVAIHGNLAVIGAYGEDEDENDENNLSKAGSAYIFERGGDGTWTEIQKIVASDRAEGDEFGFSVAIHDDLIVVGAHFCGTNAAGTGFSLHAGAAYIFEENVDGEWVEMQKIVASDRWGNPGFDYPEEDWNWRFGESVACFDDYVAVASPFASKGYVFERSGDTWSEADQLTYPGIAGLDRAGAISMDGTTIALGSQTWDYTDTPGEDHLLNSGGASVFNRNAGTGNWDFTQMIVNSDRDAGDHFGISISIEGDFIAIGTHSDNHDEDDDAELENAGSAYVFNLSGGTWTEIDKVDAGDRQAEDEFGISIGMSGTTALVGAFQQDYPAGGGAYSEDAGAAYFFTNGDVGCPTVYHTQSPAICDGESFTVGASTYTTTGSYSDVLTSVDGCDSVVTTNLTVLGGDPFEYESTICEGQSVTVGDSVYTEAGTYTNVFETEAGCDSIVETTVVVTTGIEGNVVSGDEFGLFTSAFDFSYTYQWITCDPYEVIPGATDGFYTPPGDGQYAVIVTNDEGCVDTSDCFTIGDGGGPGDDGVVLPTSGSAPEQSDCEGTVFDSGGSAGEYGSNEDSQVTISPTGATSVELEFISFDIEDGGPDCNWDWLKVYDGPTTGSPLLGTYCNSSTPPTPLTSTGGSITIEFHSDDVSNRDGFEIEWTCSTDGGGTDGIVENELTLAEVFPNPNNGSFSVVLANLNSGNVKAELLNELGQVVYADLLTDTNNLIELDNASKGMYILRLSTENEQVYKKIIIE